MPPLSKFLAEEGAVFNSHLLVRAGHFDEDELYRILCVEPARYPGSSGSRCYQDNVTDLKAQVAANHCGIRLMRQLIEEYSMDVVQVRNIILMLKKRLYANGSRCTCAQFKIRLSLPFGVF
jgi:5-oxoprolinase (ATP-hydrolysing)